MERIERTQRKMMHLFVKGKDFFDGRNHQNPNLFNRVQTGDLDYIKAVDQNVLLKARDEHENTALVIAIKKGNLDLCKVILKKCPSLLYHDNNYNTVLHEAIDPHIENFLFIDFFISVGVDELERSNNQEDAYKKFKRWMDMKSLIRGNTALLEAACFGNLHVVKRFIEVDHQYNLGLSKVVGLYTNKTALDWALQNEDLEMEKLLTDWDNPYSNFIPYSAARDLFRRVKRGELDFIKTVKLNVLLNSRDQNRMSVLSIATQCDNLDCCKEILKRCPSLLYHQNNYKWTVLHQAADLKIYRLIDFFSGAGLEATKCEGYTDNKICFKKWINMQNNVGNTALIIAVTSRSHDIVKRFVEVDHQYKLGLSAIKGKDKFTALQLAMSCKYQEIIKLLNVNNLQDQKSLQTGNSSGTGDTTVVSETNIFTSAEVSKHNNFKDSSPLINDEVNDVIKFLGDHPGGSEVFLKATGKDAITASWVCDSFIASSLSKLANDKAQLYSRVQLQEFTKDFSQPLGSGGFGVVYKGQFPDGNFIAVKVLKNIERMKSVMDEQFVAEINTMGRAYHCNLIKLHGYCFEANTEFKALVYDYMENGSFDKILFEKKLDIPWPKLHNIAKEIAQGISYLHEGCNPRIIHQDIKPANVLLDSDLSPKVIDFGLAKLVNMGESQFEQMKIKGSRDYMAPEVNQLEQASLSCKVDVYSFGKMLFDILGSKRDHVEKNRFPGQVWENYKTNKLDKFILDCGIKEEDKENAKRLAIFALLCVDHNPQARPMLSNVVKMLEGKIKLDNPITPFYPNYCSSGSSSTSDSRDC